MPVIPFEDLSPNIGPDVFIAPNAWVTGNVTIGKKSSVFFGSALRGDINAIRIGSASNIQDNAVLHTSQGIGECTVGDQVSVGHAAILHGCHIRDNCIIGMGATILDGAIISENSVVGANSLVTMYQEFPPGSLILGSPAKVVRPLKPEEIENIKITAVRYVEKSASYMKYFAEQR